MRVKKESFLLKCWNVLWPLLIYVAAQNVVSIIGTLVLMMIGSLSDADASGMVDVNVLTQSVMEQYYQYAMLFLILAALICIPIYYRMYKKDGIREGRVKRNIPMENKDYCAVILCGAALAVGMNNLISLTPLPYLFTGYEETNEVIFGGGLFLQILGGGIFACIVEELSHRGVTYLRMKHYWGKKNAMIFSALVFGIYHFNVVQGIYAFILGLFFVWLYERYDSLWAPIVAHMSANLCVILLGSSEVATNALSNLVGYSLITCISFLVFFHGWKWMKQTNPLVELEFVEKEPDTLKQLAKEYQEQERKDD